jgi:hypothetical protein
VQVALVAQVLIRHTVAAMVVMAEKEATTAGVPVAAAQVVILEPVVQDPMSQVVLLPEVMDQVVAAVAVAAVTPLALLAVEVVLECMDKELMVQAALTAALMVKADLAALLILFYLKAACMAAVAPAQREVLME